MTNDWKDLFESHILFRGLDYARSGNVDSLHVNDDSISAIVRGSEYYHVKITIDEDEVTDMYCSCPYAGKGLSCKHMAAVLYMAEDEEEYDEYDDEDDDEEEEDVRPGDSFARARERAESAMDALLEPLSRDELIGIIKDLAKNDLQIQNLLKVRLKKDVSDDDLRIWRKEVDFIIDSHSDRHGFINYHEASDFQCEISEFLASKVGTLIQRGFYLEAFELSAYVFIEVGNQDMDDDGEIMFICQDCYKLWKELITRCSETEREEIREWFELRCTDNMVDEYMEEVLVEFLDHELATEEELKEQLEYMDCLLSKARESGVCPVDYSTMSGCRSLIEARIDLMKRLGASEEQIDEFRLANWAFSEVRDYYAVKAVEFGDYEKAVEIYKESRDKEKNNSYKKHRYSEEIARLYQLLGDSEMECQELIEDFKRMGVGNLLIFRKIKQLCPKQEWADIRWELITAVKDQNGKCELLAEEKLLDVLYTCVFSNCSIELLNKFGFLLAEDYSKPILDYYTGYVEKLAEGVRNRSGYDRLTDCLKRMQVYKGGNKTVSDLASKWSAAYPTRKLMVQELQKFIL